MAIAPNQWTLAQLMQQLTKIEYSGQIDKAGIMASAIEQNASLITIPELGKSIEQVVQGFKKRISAVGKNGFSGRTGYSTSRSAGFTGVLAGKVVLVDFWASWCQPCRAEFPNLREQYNKYRERGFEIVGINIDEDIAAMQSVIRSDELPWIHARSNDAAKFGFATPQVVEFGVDAIPFMMLLGPDGKVIAVHTRGKILKRKTRRAIAVTSDRVTARATQSVRGAAFSIAIRKSRINRKNRLSALHFYRLNKQQI